MLKYGFKFEQYDPWRLVIQSVWYIGTIDDMQDKF